MKVFKTFGIIILWTLIILFAVILVALAPSLWRHWVTYPRITKEIAAFEKLRKESVPVTSLNTYQGVMHVHSFWSHDSEGTLFDIIPAAKSNNIDFIFLTDHPHGNSDTLPRGYHGWYDGVLIEAGSEKQGFDTWPLRSTVIDWRRNKDTIAGEIVQNGGILFYAHTEEDHNWANPFYQGMEIYNFHTDTKDERLLPQILNFVVNGNKYRQLALRQMFDEQTTVLARWDSLNNIRKVVGFSAVDSHENQNFRARMLKDGRVEWVGPDANPIDTVDITFRNRWLFGKPDANGWIFKWMIDTYQEGFRYITNYVMADSLSVPSLKNHILKGHLYTAFKALGDAKGFNFYAEDKQGRTAGIMGDSLSLAQLGSLKATSPLPGVFRLIHNGKVILQTEAPGYSFKFDNPSDKGAYRIEVHLMIGSKLIPWLYTNPVYVY